MYYNMYEDNLDNDCFPDPPTPISNAFPAGKSIILHILDTCYIA